ncbi:TlpA disulfide reductase family protein [Bombella sp. ESL0378]|uniref:TlpA family protein disulfide reductase n=1 Tax=Bombella sp. ESL0378 TaxID=2676442 RepID=UPI0018C206C7|nr:TlpA disulfide reductase family protein [Bombella sp. ESL0378]
MMRYLKKIRVGAVCLALLTVAAVGVRHNYAQADGLQNLQELEPEPALSAPVMLPVTGVAGQKATLPLHENKPYMLHLWATWCLPCREELPKLAALLKAHPDLPIVPVALDSGSAEQVVAALPRLHAVGLPVWVAEREHVQPFIKTVKDPGLPMTLLIDASGQVRAISDGGVTWDEAQAASIIRNLLQETE